jgi:hypothetical protein
MLTSYENQTEQLLQNPAAPATLYPTAVLDTYINTARVQVAGESGCIRYMATAAITTGNRGPYAFSGFNTGTSSANGIQGVLNARAMWYQSGSGQVWITPRSFDWFSIYDLNTTAPASGPPQEWAQYGQGVNGTVYVNQDPDQNYTLNVDAICYPIPLASDSTVEAIPPLWQTAVPYFAAYLALLAAQTGARVQDAQKMLQLYELFTARARKFANPEVMPLQYDQAVPQVQAAQYGGQGKAG